MPDIETAPIRRQPHPEKLTLDYVLTEVVRILDEERKAANDVPEQRAAA
ncbi:MAG: hypothetical protein JNL71_10995 [Rhodospirillales bacterium]|nr:hypothetical protein [Rhodospirillales bacterium]